MAREAIIEVATNKIVNIHITWEAPEGFISVPCSANIQIGDDYINGECVISAERQAEIDTAITAAASEKQQTINELTAALAVAQDIYDKIQAAITEINQTPDEEKTAEQIANISIFTEALQKKSEDIENINIQLQATQ